MGTKQIFRLPLTGALATALAVVQPSCGSDAPDPVVAPPEPVSPPGFWPPGATHGTTPQALGDVIEVPPGLVRVGYWKLKTAQRTLVAGACDEPIGGLRTYRYKVARFRLMKHEVSNRVYGSCVASGACRPPDADLADDPSGAMPWDDPRRADRPAAVSQLLARAFCRSQGGDLPTWYQWTRSAEGDIGGFGIKHLSEAWVRCGLGEVLPLCDALRSAPWELAASEQSEKTPRYRPVADVGSLPWDVGPYGHVGLFAGAGEWIRQDPTPRPLKSLCESESYLSDDFIRASYESTPDELVSLMQIGRDLALMGSLTAPDAEQIASVQHGGDTEPAGKGRYFTGFRCAFPPRTLP